MIPYILLMFVPLLFSFLAISRRNRKYTVLLGTSSEVLNNSCMLPIFFFIFFIILSMRDETIGTDLVSYRYYFDSISTLDFNELFSYELDLLFVLLNWVISRFTDNFQIFISIVAAITLLPIAIMYSKDRENGFLKIAIFMNMSTFVMLFSGLRQSIAIAVGLIAYEFVKRKKLAAFIVLAIVAWGFHHTGFMIFLYYPLYHATFKKKHLWFVIPSLLLVFVFNKPIFSLITNFLSVIYNEKYSASISSTGAYTMLILFVGFAVLSYVIPDERLMDKETLGLRNLILLAVVLQCFAPIHTLAMRMNYYYIIFIPVLISKILKYPKSITADSVLFIKSALVIFFVGYYLYTTYISCKTGISALDTYPYIPFWK